MTDTCFNIDVEDWPAFEKKLKEIQQSELAAGRTDEFLYRGQRDSSWSLLTTLERAGWENVVISDYYRIISVIKPQIESNTQNIWTIPSWPEVKQQLENSDSLTFINFPSNLGDTYSYLAHLRHHGFPSPLLDWTRSQYIAAFFAFRSNAKPKTNRVSIYIYSENPERFKVTGMHDPWIRKIGPYVKTHRRHFLQQSEYSMCARFQDGNWKFEKHEDVFARKESRQDILWKINIPWEECAKVLEWLEKNNLNAFSLFGSEESLMETLAAQYIHKNQ